MYIKVTKYDFIREFTDSMYANKFSRGALDALFDYFQDLETDLGEEFELDVTAIACEWSELTLAEALHSYSLNSLDELQDQTHVILISGDEADPENCKILMAYY